MSTHWQARATAIAGDASERKRWAARLAGKLCADGHTSKTPIAKLRTALRQTVLPRINVAVLNELEDDIRAAMREQEHSGPSIAVGSVVETRHSKPGEPEYDYGTVLELDASNGVAMVRWQLASETYPESLGDVQPVRR